jgi:hypothetical protein
VATAIERISPIERYAWSSFYGSTRTTSELGKESDVGDDFHLTVNFLHQHAHKVHAYAWLCTSFDGQSDIGQRPTGSFVQMTRKNEVAGRRKMN